MKELLSNGSGFFSGVRNPCDLRLATRDLFDKYFLGSSSYHTLHASPTKLLRARLCTALSWKRPASRHSHSHSRHDESFLLRCGWALDCCVCCQVRTEKTAACLHDEGTKSKTLRTRSGTGYLGCDFCCAHCCDAPAPSTKFREGTTCLVGLLRGSMRA